MSVGLSGITPAVEVPPAMRRGAGPNSEARRCGENKQRGAARDGASNISRDVEGGHCFCTPCFCLTSVRRRTWVVRHGEHAAGILPGGDGATRWNLERAATGYGDGR
eukprot:7380416-Prymnesium_polylepis.2